MAYNAPIMTPKPFLILLTIALGVYAGTGLHAAPNAVITAPTPLGEWGAQSIYLITFPDGSKMACELGAVNRETMHSPNVMFDCSPYTGDTPMEGTPDGKLIPRIIEVTTL